MFKLKVPKEAKSRIRNKLKIVDSKKYEYVLTTDKDEIEEDKINIVFSEDNAEKVNRMLDSIVKGEDIFITVESDKGLKHIESRRIHYFMIENEEVHAYLMNHTFSVNMKLYELEEELKNKYFLRVSKYALVNINKIDYIKPAFNSKLNLLMKNGHTVEVNRRYYKTFKKTLKL